MGLNGTAGGANRPGRPRLPHRLRSQAAACPRDAHNVNGSRPKHDGAVVAVASAGSLDVWQYRLCLVCLVSVAWGQSITLGVIGGVPVTEAYETGTGLYPHFCNYAGASSATRRYTVGPELRISLPHGFG